MPTPPSDRFQALSLAGAFNAERAALPDSLASPPALERAFGAQAFRGMPFLLGSPGAANVLLVADAPVTVATGGLTARYLIFVHYVADRPSNYLPGFADSDCDGTSSAITWPTTCCATPTVANMCTRSGAASRSSRRASAGAPVRSRRCHCWPIR